MKRKVKAAIHAAAYFLSVAAVAFSGSVQAQGQLLVGFAWAGLACLPVAILEGAGRPRHEGFAAGASSPSAPVVGSCRRQTVCQRVLARQQSERDWNLSTPRNAELLPEHVAVSLRRPRRDPEHEPDLVVRQTLRDQFDDLLLPRGDA